MNILDYYYPENRNVVVDKHKELETNYHSVITKLKDTGKLDVSDAIFLTKYKGSIVTSLKFISLVNSLDNKFQVICKELFPHIFIDLSELHLKIIQELPLQLSNDQKDSIKLCCDFLLDPKKTVLGIYGSAGSGKTTVISHFIRYLIDNKYVSKIAATAPTNQALKVLESKIDIHASNNISFQTVQSILGYIKVYDTNNNMKFIQSNNKLDLGKSYDIVFVDECSMLSADIVNTFMKLENCKIIFIGDIAQLPPVNENTSLAFQIVQDNIVMKTNMRNGYSDVIAICNEVRDWVLNVSKSPNLSKHILKVGDKKVYAYKHDKSKVKTENLWFKVAKKYHTTMTDVSNIILAWTNMQCDQYNNTMRENAKQEFIINDILIFNSFYTRKDVKYHTSCQVRVNAINETVKSIPLFPIIDINKMDIPGIGFIKTKYLATISSINSGIKRNYNAWLLTVTKLLANKNDEIDKMPNEIVVIKNIDYDKLLEDGDNSSKKIKELWVTFSEIYKNNDDALYKIEEFIIKPLWNEWNKRFVDMFANVNYAISVTVHKSQGSTFFNVFVDGQNILQNPNNDESKRCFYTAVSRTSNSLHILL